jgi:hypothetical protein
MKTRNILFAFIIPGLYHLSACAPSHQYMQGRGFYSESFSEADIEAAAKEGKVRNAGHFSVDASECGVYTPGLADNRIVIPTLKDRLLYMGGNAVQNVKATERADFIAMSFLTGLMACEDLTISGDVVYVDRPKPDTPPPRE